MRRKHQRPMPMFSEFLQRGKNDNDEVSSEEDNTIIAIK